MPNLNLNLITDNGRITYLSGKKKGLAAREILGLDALDKSADVVVINIPDNFDCNESFLGGLFSNSISVFQSRVKFLEKYSFESLPEALEERLNNVITATLSEGTGLSILNKP